MDEGGAKVAVSTMLRVSPDALLQVGLDGNVTAQLRDVRIPCGPEGLDLLGLFVTPTSYGDALNQLQSRVVSADAWIRLSATIIELASSGLLEIVDRTPGASGAQGPDWSPPSPHIAMLNDVSRTAAFGAAIRDAVGPEDVVVDIGTGTGVLAAMAAKAGARHVYAIEASGAAEYAEALFKANALGPHITLLRGWSSRIDLPEHATVLITETLGSDPLDEHLLDIVLDARKRFLRPGGRVIPSRVRLYAAAFEAPAEVIRKRRFVAKDLRRWSELYDIDFTSLEQVASVGFLKTPVGTLQDWRQCGDLVLLADLDLEHLERSVIDVSARIAFREDVIVNAAGVFFDAVVGDHALTTRPDAAPDDNHWFAPIWLLPAAIPCRPGQEVVVRYRTGGAIRRPEDRLLVSTG